jgi:hypothetical protein
MFNELLFRLSNLLQKWFFDLANEISESPHCFLTDPRPHITSPIKLIIFEGLVKSMHNSGLLLDLNLIKSDSANHKTNRSHSLLSSLSII